VVEGRIGKEKEGTAGYGEGKGVMERGDCIGCVNVISY
jgi:hypothetical protein